VLLLCVGFSCARFILGSDFQRKHREHKSAGGRD